MPTGRHPLFEANLALCPPLNPPSNLRLCLRLCLHVSIAMLAGMMMFGMLDNVVARSRSVDLRDAFNPVASQILVCG
jgi:hypothetical protein